MPLARWWAQKRESPRRRVGESLLGAGQCGAYPVVLARFDDAWQLGFQIERGENGLVAVFIPGAPQPNPGEVYWLSADRVPPVEMPPATALKCLVGLGAGSSAFTPRIHAQEDHCFLRLSPTHSQSTL